MMNSLWWWLIPSKGRFESLVLPFQFQLSWWDPEDTLHVSFLSVFPPHPVPCAEIGNQHMVSAQCLYAGCMPDLIPDGSLSEPHHHKKRNTTLSSSSCFYISLDSIKRSWFFFFYLNQSHCNWRSFRTPVPWWEHISDTPTFSGAPCYCRCWLKASLLPCQAGVEGAGDTA